VTLYPIYASVGSATNKLPMDDATKAVVMMMMMP
jgi:hypothetical protein